MAGRIPRQFIDELIARVDLVDLIDARVPLKKAGINYQARCPFHTEKTPSFNVNRDKQLYHCFGCGASGNAIGFLMDYERQSFLEAVETLADSLGLEIPQESDGSERRAPETDLQPLYQVQAQAADYYARQLREHPEAGGAREYLKGRGLTGETARRFQIGYAPSGWRNLPDSLSAEQLLASGLVIGKDGGGFYDRFRGRVMFPIRDRRGRVVGFGGRVLGDEKPKYLNSPETPTFKKHREVFGLYELLSLRQKIERIVVVEGYMDVISLAQHDVPYAVATLGTATSPDHAAQLFRYAKELVFCFDGDNAGRNAAWKALEASLPELREGRSIRFLMLPQEHDPDSLVREEGREGFESRLADAQALSDYFFQHLSENLDLASIEGRAALVQSATPLLGKLPDGVFRDMMRTKLGQLTGHGVTVGRVTRPRGSSSLQKFKPELGKPSNLRIILALLIQNPSFIQLIDANARLELEREEKAGPLAKKLFELIGENENLNCGGLLEHFRDQPELPQVNKLAVLEIPLSSLDMQTEFCDTLNKFISQLSQPLIEQRKDWLDKKAKAVGISGLSEAEREEYRRLLSKK